MDMSPVPGLPRDPGEPAGREPAIVVFGDVVGSRDTGSRGAMWLSDLAARLDAAYGGAALAPWQFTQGDEIQGLLAPDADPFRAVLEASLAPGSPTMRWVIAAGEVDPGEGPATQRTGPAFLEARRLIGTARRRRDGMLAISGSERADRLLDAIAPVLGELMEGLTARQREIAGLVLIGGLTQAEVADALGVSRATVSVSHRRAGVRSIARLLQAVRIIFREGAQLARGAGMVPP